MKITINNLGPIHHFEFDLSKDISVIFGKNNIGKSYAITAVYIIIKNLIRYNFKPLFELGDFLRSDFFLNRNLSVEYFHKMPKIFKEIYDIKNQIIDRLKEKEELNVTEYFQKLFTMMIEENIKEGLEKSFINSFSSIEGLKNELNDEKFSIKLMFTTFSFSILNDKSKIQISNVKLNKDFIIKKSVTNQESIEDSERITIYYNKKSESRINDFYMLDSMIFVYSFFTSEISEAADNIYFLPASRSGLYKALNSFSSIIAELSKSRNFLSNRLELPNISEPVIDYFLNLANINSKIKNNKYGELVSDLEKDILQGVVSFNNENKKIVVKPNNISAELDLSFTSSMVSEIAPIVAFIKYVISEGIDLSNRYVPYEIKEPYKRASNLIFIEEPEAHLHPEVQVKMMEWIVILAKYGIKIIMTTHSNYMFNKLSNLILDKKIDYQKVGSYLMRMTDKGSVVDENLMPADPEGIQDENFAETSEKLYEERIAIYDRLNEDADK